MYFIYIRISDLFCVEVTLQGGEQFGEAQE